MNMTIVRFVKEVKSIINNPTMFVKWILRILITTNIFPVIALVTRPSSKTFMEAYMFGWVINIVIIIVILLAGLCVWIFTDNVNER